MQICVHTLVKNEERYLWFAVSAVTPYVDKVLLWDTGSTDNTIKISKELIKKYGDKIDFKEVGNVDIRGFTEVRQDMLERTKADWFVIVDGDEVWWDHPFKAMVDMIREKGDLLDSIGCRFYNLVGDIFHYQDESAGKYSIDGKVGHLTIRAINRKIPRLHFGKPHGQQGIFDGDEKLIQELRKSRRKFIDKQTYLHFTHVRRSSKGFDEKVPKRSHKLKYEIGKELPLDFYYPEVFFRPKPNFTHSPWDCIDRAFLSKAYVQTPLKRIKRSVVRSGSGY